MVLYLSASLRIGVKRNERFDFRAKKKSPRVSCRNLQMLPPTAPSTIFLKALSQLVEALRAPGPRIEAEIDAVSDQIAK